MPGPLHLPALLFVYPFRYRDEHSGKWMRARYVAERHEIAERYKDWEIVGPDTLPCRVQPAERGLSVC